MNKQHILKLYKAALHLYPKDFRDTYAEQMQLTAQDLLADTSTKAEAARVYGQLLIDLLVAATKENGKQLGGTMKRQLRITTKKSALAALLLALQISGVLIMSYFYLLMILYAVSYTAETMAPAYLGLITTTTPILCMPIAFYFLRRVPRFSAWTRIVWSYGVGAAGAVAYFFFGSFFSSLQEQFYPGLLSSIDNTNILYIYWHDWLIVAAFFALFFVFASKLAARLANSGARSHTDIAG
jgi:hypothetical protein